MTSLNLTEEEAVRVLSHGPTSFEKVVSELWRARRVQGVKRGSRSTISLALRSLYRKGFVDYDVETRKWRITLLGHWIMIQAVQVSESTLALIRVMDPLFSTVREKPEKLTELLSGMFEDSFGRKGKFSEQEKMMLKQTETRLTLFIKQYPDAVEAIWGDGVKRLVGGFSGLLAAILVHRSSLAPDPRTQASITETIPKIVDQYFKSLSAELGKVLSNHLADIAALDLKVKADRSHHTTKKTGR